EHQDILQTIHQHPDRFLSWAFVNPKNSDAIEVCQKLLENPAVIGVKLHPFWHKFGLKDAGEIFRLCESLNLPVNIHLGFDDGGDFQWLVENFPRLKIIFGHLGVPYYKTLWNFIKDKPQTYVDLASLYHVDESLFK